MEREGGCVAEGLTTKTQIRYAFLKQPAEERSG